MAEAEPSTEILSQAGHSFDLVHQLRINCSLVILALFTHCIVLCVCVCVCVCVWHEKREREREKFHIHVQKKGFIMLKR